jgi:glucokinase
LSPLAAIDVGGTKTLVEIFDARPIRTLHQVELPTPRSGDVIGAVTDAVLQPLAGRSLTALVVGCPGPLDRGAGVVMDPPNLSRGWWHLPLGRALHDVFRCPVTLENDANLGALGEAVSGAGRGFPSVLYITVSTGIGAGFVVDGDIFPGARGFGLEVGHTTVNSPHPVRCACGREGCLESLASGSAIATRAWELGFPALGGEVTARSVAAAAESGAPLGHQVMEEAAGYLAQGIVNFLYVLDPSVVLIGGGVAQSDLFIDLVREAITAEKLMDPFQEVPVRQAELGRFSVITGAKVLAGRLLTAGS